VQIQNVDIKLPSGYELCISDIYIYEQYGKPVSGKIYFSSDELKQIDSEAHRVGCWQTVKELTLSFWDDAANLFYKLEILLDKIPIDKENSFKVSKILKPTNEELKWLIKQK
jgi:hypothetical protein